MRTRSVTSVVVLLAFAASGCQRWTAPAPPAPFTAGARLGQVRVTLADGRQLLLHKARVQRDSLVGDTLEGISLSLGDNAPPLAIPLADIRALSGRQFSPGRTALLVGGISVALAAAAALSFGSNYHPQFFGAY